MSVGVQDTDPDVLALVGALMDLRSYDFSDCLEWRFTHVLRTDD